MKCRGESSSPLPIDLLSRKQAIVFQATKNSQLSHEKPGKANALTDNDPTCLLKDTYASCSYESDRLRSGDASGKSRFSLNVSDAISFFLLFFSAHATRTWLSRKVSSNAGKSKNKNKVLHNQSIRPHDADRISSEQRYSAVLFLIYVLERITMGADGVSDRRQRGGCLMFLTEFKALLIKMLLLTKRRRAQTIAEIILAYVFLALLLAMRSLLDRTYHEPLRIPTFRPHDLMSAKSTRANMTYYYPRKCVFPLCVLYETTMMDR